MSYIVVNRKHRYSRDLGMYDYEVKAEIADMAALRDMLPPKVSGGDGEADRVIEACFGPVPSSDQVEEIF